MDDRALIERLTAERDRAREECGVAKSRADFYNAEMMGYLRKLPRQVDDLRGIEALPAGSTVRGRGGAIYYKELQSGACWQTPGAEWFGLSTVIELPATVLAEPGTTK